MADKMAETPEEPKSMESDMLDMFTKAQETVPDEKQPEAEAQPAEDTGKPERQRDESGKFVKADKDTPAIPGKKEASPEKPAKAQATPKAPDAEVEAAKQPQEQDAPDKPASSEEGAEKPIRPPASWSAAAKAVFNELDPVVQKEVMRREDDFHKGIEQYKTGHHQAEEFNQVVQPYLPLIQAEGGTPIAAVRDLLNTAYQIRQDPVRTIGMLMQQFGVDPSVYAQQQTDEPLDPRLAQIQQQAHQAHQAALQAQQWQQQQVQQQQKELDQWASGEYQKFANDPKNVYLENVKEDMAALLKEGRAKDYQEAYDKACWQNPDVRAVLLQQERKVAEQKRVDEARQKAANAKRAAFDVAGTGSAEQGERKLGLEEELLERYRSS